MSRKQFFDVPDFLKPLLYLGEGYPREEIDEVILRREEATPHLLAALEWMLTHTEEAIDEYEYMLSLYAMYLLAQFREKKAKPMMIALARHPLSDDLLGDVITEGLHLMLASLCCDDPEALKLVVEDLDADPFARSAAIEALGTLCLKGHYSRDALSSYLSELYDFKLEKEPSFVWDGAVGVSVDLCLSEHRDLIKRAYLEGLADESVDNLLDVLSRLDNERPYFTRDHRFRFADDIHREISKWYCFTDKYVVDKAKRQKKPKEYVPVRDEPANIGGYSDVPYLRPERKIGRNEPCPCGSGKKYKKCCGK
ncbi:MAG: DUF1186 domain-containing protein [Verrucomicrobia bacterium]|nr:DUF1186 domain-containing protein [Verrucomicrobiota bacterium]MDA1066842.1 DUF1186 domain-containing protein [Verrucomicrobiota bacterium]